MDKKQAQQIYDIATKTTIRHYYFYKDQTEKAFLCILHKLRKEKEFYENKKIKFIGKEAQEEIVRIYNSFIIELEKQMDIVSNGERANSYAFNLSVESIQKEDMNFTGFNGGLSL